MADRSKALPGDILMYRNKGFLGGAIAFAEWTGKSQEAIEYSHIGQVLSRTESYETNPPKSRIFSLDTIDWPAVDLFRFNIGGMNPYEQPGMVARLRIICEKRVGTPYDYGFIIKALGIGLLARIGFQSYSQHLAHHIGGDTHATVCSEEMQVVNELALQISNLFPDNNSARPSDWPNNSWLKQVI